MFEKTEDPLEGSLVLRTGFVEKLGKGTCNKREVEYGAEYQVIHQAKGSLVVVT